MSSNHPFIFLFPVNALCHQKTLGRGTSNGLPGDLHAKTCWDRLPLNNITAPSLRLQIAGLAHGEQA